jgi:hypothetical protein
MLLMHYFFTAGCHSNKDTRAMDFSIRYLAYVKKKNTINSVKESFPHKYPGFRVPSLSTFFILVKKCFQLELS